MKMTDYLLNLQQLVVNFVIYIHYMHLMKIRKKFQKFYYHSTRSTLRRSNKVSKLVLLVLENTQRRMIHVIRCVDNTRIISISHIAGCNKIIFK